MIEQDIANYISNNTSLTKGTDLFIGTQPDSPAGLAAVYNTGGGSPDMYLPTAVKTFQVLVRDDSYSDCASTVDDIVDLLHQLRNETIGSTYFYTIDLMGEPTHIGKDEKGRDEFSMNFATKTRR